MAWLFGVATAVTTANAAWSPLPPGVGAVLNQPAVARNLDGRILVFAVRSDRQIWYLASVDASPNAAPDGETAWHEWRPLGGAFCPSSSPVAATDASGRVYVFGLTCDGRVWHKWQLEIGDVDAWDSPWRQPRRTLDDPPITLGSRPELVRNADGRLQLFARLQSGDVIATMKQTSDNPFAVWSEWEWLDVDAFVGGVSAIANADGRLEVFARSSDGSVWHAWELQPGAGWSGFSVLPSNVASDPVAVRNQDGRLQVFAVTPGGSLYHAWQETAGTTANWSVWHLLGGEVTGAAEGTGDFLHGLEAVVGEDGRIGVFVQDDNFNLWTRWQKRPSSSSWGYWTSVCGESAEIATVEASAERSTEIFVRRSDGGLHGKQCDRHCVGEAPKVVTLLTYHGFYEPDDPPPPGSYPLFVKPTRFREQLRYLRDNGFTPVQTPDLEQICDVERPVVITVDDGLKDNVSQMYPILGEPEFNTPAFTARVVLSPITIRVATGNPNYLSVTDLQTMLDRAVIENHSHTHPDLTELTEAQVIAELETASGHLASWTGRAPAAFVYPKGLFDATVLAATRERFHYGMAGMRTLFRLGQDRYRIPRLFVHRDDDLAAFAAKIDLCSHSEYEIGPALAEGCGGGIPGEVPEANCTVAVCAEATRAYCCDLGASAGWDEDCVETARDLCDIGEP